MKKVLIAVLVSLPLIAYNQVKTPCKQAKEFSTIQVYDGIVATLERGEKNELCGGSGTKLEDLLISIEDGVLRVRKIAGKKYENQPRLKIIYTNISRVEAYNNADLDTRNLIKTDSLHIILKTGSRFYADCDVKFLQADVSEGSLLKIDGYAVHQKVNAGGKANFSGFELEGDTAEVKAARGGIIKLNIEKIIKGTVSTGGHITYKSSPKVDVKTSSGGKVVAN